MIRLPPTTITLTPADLRDLYGRRWSPQAVAIQYGFASPQLAQDELSDNRPHASHSDKRQIEKQRRIMGHGPPQGDGTMAIASSSDPADSSSQLESRLAPYRSRKATRITNSAVSEDDTDYHDVIDLRDTPSASSSSSSDENTDYQATSHTWSARDDFHYGGFTETPRPKKSTQNDYGDERTPHLQAPEAQQTGSRVVLPRSPLFISQNSSISPEHPRASGNGQQNDTPSTLFSQPARRHPGITFGSFTPTSIRPQRVWRHQTNSFSLDSNERASAVYEQDRVSSASSSESNPLSTMRSLGEELRNSSLESQRAAVSARASSLESQLEELTKSPVPEMFLSDGSLLFSSPRLNTVSSSNKPSSNSTTSRSVYEASRNVDTSNAKAPRSEQPQRRHGSRSRISRHEEQSSSSASHSGTSTSQRSRRFLNLHRDRSTTDDRRSDGSPDHPFPSPSLSPSSSPSSTAQPSSPNRVSQTMTPQPRTPSSIYRVYNDSLPPSSQPQTPAHLAEARHQSRFHPSFTAPVVRNNPRLGTSVTTQGGRGGRGIPFNIVMIDRSRSRTTSVVRSRHQGRTTSPAGLVAEGFRGLYGGRENGDDEANYLEGVQFDGAPRRLWEERGS